MLKPAIWTRLLCLALIPLMLAARVQAADSEAYSQQVQQMYLAYYGRPGDPGGVTYWSGRLEAAGGNWITDLVNAFGTSAEYTDRFGGLSQAVLITNLYRQLFNREPDPGGLAFYVDLLNGSNSTGFNPDGRVSTLAQLALDIANGATGEDRDIIANKLQVSDYFTNSVASSDTPYTEDDIDDAVAILAGVTSSESTVASGESGVNTFVRLSGFRVASISLAGEEIVLVGAGYGPPGVAVSLYGGSVSGIVHADLSPDGQTVWVLTQDNTDPVDGGWGLYIMDRTGTNVVRKSLPEMGGYSGRPEVAIADSYGSFGFVSVPYWVGNARHWRIYSTTWHDDTGLLEKLDTFDAAQLDPDFPANAFINFAPVDLRAVDGVEGFYFLNGDGVWVANESSPGRPIRVGWTQDLLWNGEPPAANDNWYGLDVGGGRWLSNLELAENREAVIGGSLVGTVFNMQFVAADGSESVEERSEISDDGEYLSFCLYVNSSTFECYAGEYGGVTDRVLPVNSAWQVRSVGISGAGNRIWGEESNLIGSQWTFVSDRNGSNAHRAGARLESYAVPVLDEDGDTLLVQSRYGNGIQFRWGLTLISYQPGLLGGPMPTMRDFRYAVSDSLVQLDVAVDDNVSAVRAQVFKGGYGNSRWFNEASPYPSWLGGSGGYLTRGDDGRFSLAITIYGTPGAGDVVRLTAFDDNGNRTSFIDAPLVVTN